MRHDDRSRDPVAQRRGERHQVQPVRFAGDGVGVPVRRRSDVGRGRRRRGPRGGPSRARLRAVLPWARRAANPAAGWAWPSWQPSPRAWEAGPLSCHGPAVAGCASNTGNSAWRRQGALFIRQHSRRTQFAPEVRVGRSTSVHRGLPGRGCRWMALRPVLKRVKLLPTPSSRDRRAGFHGDPLGPARKSRSMRRLVFWSLPFCCRSSSRGVR